MSQRYPKSIVFIENILAGRRQMSCHVQSATTILLLVFLLCLCLKSVLLVSSIPLCISHALSYTFLFVLIFPCLPYCILWKHVWILVFAATSNKSKLSLVWNNLVRCKTFSWVCQRCPNGSVFFEIHFVGWWKMSFPKTYGISRKSRRVTKAVVSSRRCYLKTLSFVAEDVPGTALDPLGRFLTLYSGLPTCSQVATSYRTPSNPYRNKPGLPKIRRINGWWIDLFRHVVWPLIDLWRRHRVSRCQFLWNLFSDPLQALTAVCPFFQDLVLIKQRVPTSS